MPQYSETIGATFSVSGPRQIRFPGFLSLEMMAYPRDQAVVNLLSPCGVCNFGFFRSPELEVVLRFLIIGHGKGFRNDEG